MEFTFRQAGQQDADAIISLLEDGKQFLREQGLPQWQNGYPNAQSVAKDIAMGQAYLLFANGSAAGTLALCYGAEPAYNTMVNGSWLTGGEYATIHRVAVAKACRGSKAAAVMLKRAEKIAKNKNLPAIRIDTHEDNLPMQRFLQKNGYIRCGTVFLNGGIEDGEKRIGFEKIL